MDDKILYLKKVKCPVCNNEFETSKIRSSRLRIEKKDTDLLTYYKTENPIKYNIFVCPECGFSAMEKRFVKMKSEQREIIKEKVSTKWVSRDYSGYRSIEKALETYKISLYCGQLLQIGSYELGTICLRIGWLNRMIKNPEENKYLRFTINLFEDFYFNGTFSGETSDDVTIGYLIGELHRRLGENKEAIDWFSRTLSSPNINNNFRLKKLAREQWSMAKESAKTE